MIEMQHRHQNRKSEIRSRSLGRSISGTAAIELALALPLLLTVLFGIVAYGDWFMLSHNIQQAANDAARATMSGVNPAERAAIASESISASLRRAGVLDPARASVQMEDDGASVAVRLSYNASNDPILAFPLLPVPSTTIQRTAVVRLDSI